MITQPPDAHACSTTASDSTSADNHQNLLEQIKNLENQIKTITTENLELIQQSNRDSDKINKLISDNCFWKKQAILKCGNTHQFTQQAIDSLSTDLKTIIQNIYHEEQSKRRPSLSQNLIAQNTHLALTIIELLKNIQLNCLNSNNGGTETPSVSVDWASLLKASTSIKAQTIRETIVAAVIQQAITMEETPVNQPKFVKESIEKLIEKLTETNGQEILKSIVQSNGFKDYLTSNDCLSKIQLSTIDPTKYDTST